MIQFIDEWALPGLLFLADWSVRWGVVLAVLAAWIALRPPRSAAMRHVLCSAALVAGLLIPLSPRWGNLAVQWPEPAAKRVESVTPVIASPEPSAAFAVPYSEGHRFEAPIVQSHTTSPVTMARSSSMPLGLWRLLCLAAALAWAVGALTCLIQLAGGWLVLFKSRSASRDFWRTTCCSACLVLRFAVP